ncbi:hypothetical protein P8452_32140 [Trifolium repens]|nr:hypothetical protein P8452_32140 [Trifolium repens]
MRYQPTYHCLHTRFSSATHITSQGCCWMDYHSKESISDYSTITIYTILAHLSGKMKISSFRFKASV